jgi:hypothetical protein
VEARILTVVKWQGVKAPSSSKICSLYGTDLTRTFVWPSHWTVVSDVESVTLASMTMSCQQDEYDEQMPTQMLALPEICNKKYVDRDSE